MTSLDSVCNTIYLNNLLYIYLFEKLTLLFQLVSSKLVMRWSLTPGLKRMKILPDIIETVDMLYVAFLPALIFNQAELHFNFCN